MPTYTKVSLICTVLNEKSSLKRLMESISAQTRMPDEVVIVDGGSSDGSAEVIREYAKRLNIKVYVVQGVNIAQGRNIAIRNASHEVIASTDAGCELDRNWLENIVEPFEENPSVDVVAGVYLPKDVNGAFERSVAELCYPRVENIKCEEFLPSSRSIAFKKEAWKRARGYPEWLQTAEDTVFDLQLKREGCKFVLARTAVAFWSIPNNLGNLLLKFFRYGRGDAEAGRYAMPHFGTNTLKSLLYLSGLLCFILACVSSNYCVSATLVLGTFFYLYFRVFSRIDKGSVFSGRVLLIILLAILVDIASIVGFSFGIVTTVGNRFLLIMRTDRYLSYS